MASGAISFGSGGSGVTANIAALASASTNFTIKWCQKVDNLRGLSANSSCAAFLCDSAGNGTNTKFHVHWATDGSGNIQLNFVVPGAGTITSLNAAVTNLSQKTQIANAAGSVIGAFTNTQGINGGTNFLPTTGGANGEFSLNYDGGAHTQTAQEYLGAALYSAVLTGANLTSAPSSGDANIVAGWSMNDAFTGTSPSTLSAFTGTGIVLSGSYNYTSDVSPWQAATAGSPPKSVKQAGFAARHRSFYY